MIQQNVVQQSDNRVLRYGFCDFATDGQFDPVTESIVEKDFTFTEPLEAREWYWNGVTQTFDMGAEIPAKVGRIQILHEIMLDAEAAGDFQQILEALDKRPSFIAALDAYNYDLARSIVDMALAAGDITQVQKDRILTRIPA